MWSSRKMERWSFTCWMARRMPLSQRNSSIEPPGFSPDGLLLFLIFEVEVLYFRVFHREVENFLITVRHAAHLIPLILAIFRD